jgi:hypothetical protein
MPSNRPSRQSFLSLTDSGNLSLVCELAGFRNFPIQTLVPDLLLRFGFHSELAGVDIRDRAPHAVVSLTTIERFLYALPKF